MNRKLAVGLGLACVACCAPLIVPLLGAASLSGLGGRLAGLDWLEVLCAAVLAAALAGIIVLVVRQRRARANGPYCDVKE
ncbi:MAG: hypothetical protein JNJ73_13350 [Hyphomonadaceae bacterium]|nr:hypothetical protein [Hyphomonadaceae bacterium]